MLSCRDVTNIASEYLAGELPLFKRMSFRMHVFMCKRCERYMHQLEITVQALKGLGSVDKVSDQATQDVVELLKQHVNKHKP